MARPLNGLPNAILLLQGQRFPTAKGAAALPATDEHDSKGPADHGGA